MPQFRDKTIRQDRRCARCGNDYETFKASRSVFCSTKCAKGGPNHYCYIDGRASSKNITQALQWEKHPERQRARQILRDAVRRQRVFRKPCEVCGDVKSQAHHEDYCNPIDVMWLCSTHHKALHQSKLPPINFTKFPIRKSTRDHVCYLCGLDIIKPDFYYDANQAHNKRAHLECGKRDAIKECGL